MGTVYEDAVAAHSAAADTIYAERFTFRPMAQANDDMNARKGSDPDRAALHIHATFLQPYARAFSGEARRQGVKAEHPGHASSRPQIEIDIDQVPFKIRDGDQVERHKTGAVYTIAEIKFPSVGTRRVFDLNLVTPPSRDRER
jgi:hypothetical protein